MINKNIFVVTGGTSGLGLAIAEKIYKNGGLVVVLGRNDNNIKKINKKYNYKKLIAFKCDISVEENIQDIFKHIKKKYGFVYGLVNNAGINPSRSGILDTSFLDWKKTIDTNLTGYFLCSKFAIKHMKKLKRGSIVNISSVASYGMKDRISYSSSKAGIIGFTKSLALDHADEGIRVNCICPGYIPTKLVEGYLKNLSKKNLNNLIDRHPMKKLGKPEDVANASKFFLSSESSWITGAILNVDGGYSIY